MSCTIIQLVFLLSVSELPATMRLWILLAVAVAAYDLH